MLLTRINKRRGGILIMIWFTADTHFWHENILKHCDRPFENIQQMNAKLIANWNNVVKSNDTIWHLGDFSWGNLYTVQSIYNMLNGIKHIIPGNHDNVNYLKKVFGEKFVHHGRTVIKYEGRRLVADHYAMLRWPGCRRGYKHIFGHSHGTLCHPNVDAIDVGVDLHNYTPINIDQIFNIINGRNTLNSLRGV